MLKRLTITNYLLIEALELDLAEGLTSSTGETGSGKSIKNFKDASRDESKDKE